MNRQHLCEIIGISTLITHIVFSIYVWFLFEGRYGEILGELTLPLTIAYTVAVVKWFIAHQHYHAKQDMVRIPFAIVCILIVGTMLLSMPVGLYFYSTDFRIQPEQINAFFLFLQSVFGAIFALIMGELFDSSEQQLRGRSEGES